MNILIIRLSALGDVAMTIPAIYSVARAHPQHTFFVLTSPFCGHLFVNSPENVVLVEPPSQSLHGIMVRKVENTVIPPNILKKITFHPHFFPHFLCQFTTYPYFCPAISQETATYLLKIPLETTTPTREYQEQYITIRRTRASVDFSVGYVGCGRPRADTMKAALFLCPLHSCKPHPSKGTRTNVKGTV